MASLPLAERMRPQHIDDIVGQETLTGKAALLRRMLSEGKAFSFILFGPPGTGKTTLARCVAPLMGRPFHALSAAHNSVKDIKQLLDTATEPFLLFLDEIHRFSKSQQDILLQPMETGQLQLIGGTTEHPGFEINKALLSRCHIFTLRPLDDEALHTLLLRALREDALLRSFNLRVDNPQMLIPYAGGDARRLFNLLESLAQPNGIIDEKALQDLHSQGIIPSDKKGEAHYNYISAFIKSMRGSDPNAALLWLAHMLSGGEDPVFIARRMVIFAAEDIGMANPNAQLLANATFDAVQKIGMPEGRIPLSACTIYLSTSPKSNSAYKAINKAMEWVGRRASQVPLHLCPSSHHIKDYLYPHHSPEHFIFQEYMPPNATREIFYEPAHNAKEKALREQLKKQWQGKYPY